MHLKCMKALTGEQIDTFALFSHGNKSSVSHVSPLVLEEISIKGSTLQCEKTLRMSQISSHMKAKLQVRSLLPFFTWTNKKPNTLQNLHKRYIIQPIK